MRYSTLLTIAAIAGKLALRAAWLKAKVKAWRNPRLKIGTHLHFEATVTADVRFTMDTVDGSAIGSRTPGTTKAQNRSEARHLRTEPEGAQRGNVNPYVD